VPGTVAGWLAGHTRPGGSVLATDISPRHLPARPDFSVRARLVLLHLPQRHTVLRRLLAALKPGGALLLEEFDCGYAPVLSLPPGADPAVFPRFKVNRGSNRAMSIPISHVATC
jgi:hypothetical protein